MTKTLYPITVLGAGSWGTALAIQLCRAGGPVTLWGHEPELMADIDTARCNERYLPGIPLPESLHLSADLSTALAGVQDVLVVVPSHAFRAVLDQLRDVLDGETRLAWATKGLESGSGKLLHEVAGEVLGEAVPMAVVSGPTFAREVAEGLPTAVTVASNDEGFAADLAARLHSSTFRAYTSHDVPGVEVGGAVKNVLAIAAGIADGLGYGANARTALITRGLAEMMRLGEVLGGQRETFMGLAGLGDLVLTCTDDQSRNRRLGLALGRGQRLEEALAAIDQVVEGVQTAREVRELALSRGVDMPITEQVYAVLYEARKPKKAVKALLDRHQKPELS
ncbi:MAG TPA: NAD(P)H-dependent glycerol-3-phosphate dehydrogenase [Gammaproteobacteria bacterium]|nr:NAD(P)H-dependent glycerol-3-phosphate dehydrogenase [Gammaproteobacteria bacterium]